MAIKTLKTLVLKTATVSGVKPVAAADRIGRGLAVVAVPPMELLSRGQFPLPADPVSNSEPGERSFPSVESQHMPRFAMADAALPVDSAGCLRGSGSPAGHGPWPLSARPATGTPTAAKRTGRTSSHPHAGSFSWRDRDCQSLRRRDDRNAVRTQRHPQGYRGAWEAVAARMAAGK